MSCLDHSTRRRSSHELTSSRSNSLRPKPIHCTAPIGLSRAEDRAREARLVRRVGIMVRLEGEAVSELVGVTVLTYGGAVEEVAGVELYARLGRVDVERAAGRRLGEVR